VQPCKSGTTKTTEKMDNWQAMKRKTIHAHCVRKPEKNNPRQSAGPRKKGALKPLPATNFWQTSWGTNDSSYPHPLLLEGH